MLKVGNKKRQNEHLVELEKLEADRLMTIINNMTDAAIVTNARGKIQLFNSASLDLLDTNANLKGRSISEFLRLSDQSDSKLSILDLLTNANRTTTRDDLNHNYTDGEKVRLNLIYSPIRSSYNPDTKTQERGGYVLIMRDITKAKSLEEERDEFISVVSHELRTPVTIMEGALSNLIVMLEKSGGDKKSIGMVTTAHDQAIYLAKMINDLSTLSRAERGAYADPEWIDNRELAEKLHQVYQKDAAKKGLRFDLDLGVRLGGVYTSRLYVEELLQNFITNAIKYTRQGGLTLSMKVADGKITYTIKDTGIGLSRSDQSKVFLKFYRSEDYRVRETPGTGLGLYTASKLAKRLGTEIQFKSRLNHGSEFGFSLPLAEKPKTETAKPQPSKETIEASP